MEVIWFGLENYVVIDYWFKCDWGVWIDMFDMYMFVFLVKGLDEVLYDFVVDQFVVGCGLDGGCDQFIGIKLCIFVELG